VGEENNKVLPSDCPLIKEWALYKFQQEEASKKMSEIHSIATKFAEAMPHLQHLDMLPVIARSNGEIKDSNYEIKDKLLDSATGRKQFSAESVMLMIKIFGSVIIVQTLAIMFLLTGQHFGLFSLVGGK